MSTRCMIKVAGHEPVIYKHSDGYPDGKPGVLATLTPFLKKFFKYRPADDGAYLLARILDAFMQDDRKYRAAFERSHTPLTTLTAREKRENREERETTGYGIEPEMNHSDIEWFYVVDMEDRKVQVYTTTREFWDSPTVENLELSKIVDF
jgi:hypothetical protein